MLTDTTFLRILEGKHVYRSELMMQHYSLWPHCSFHFVSVLVMHFCLPLQVITGHCGVHFQSSAEGITQVTRIYLVMVCQMPSLSSFQKPSKTHIFCEAFFNVLFVFNSSLYCIAFAIKLQVLWNKNLLIADQVTYCTVLCMLMLFINNSN